MAAREISQAEMEQRYLQQNAVLMLVVGLYLLLDGSYQLFFSNQESEWFVILFGLVAAILLGVGLLTCLRSLRYCRRAVFWTHQFSDEWLAHLNMRGYRSTAHFLIALLLITYLLNRFEFMQEWLMGLDLTIYSTALLATGAITYAAPVLWGLRTTDE